MKTRYVFLRLVVLAASVLLAHRQEEQGAAFVGVLLETAFPKVDPATLKAKVSRFIPADERGALAVAATTFGEVEWVGMEATARFEPWPSKCQRYQWGIGYYPHVESVDLPAEAQDGRFVVRLEHAPAPEDLYGNGVCSWDLKELRFFLTGKEIHEGIPGATATFILPGELLRGGEPKSFACRPNKRDGGSCATGLVPPGPSAEGGVATIEFEPRG